MMFLNVFPNKNSVCYYHRTPRQKTSKKKNTKILLPTFASDTIIKHQIVSIHPNYLLLQWVILSVVRMSNKISALRNCNNVFILCWFIFTSWRVTAVNHFSKNQCLWWSISRLALSFLSADWFSIESHLYCSMLIADTQPSNATSRYWTTICFENS